VGHGAAVLGELVGAQHAHVADALHAAGFHVGGELLVPVNGQPFLEGQLEPVAAGDAVAGPVVEVLVADYLLDRPEVVVGGGFRNGQHVAGVEDVEPLVLHGAHVEIVHCHDHEQVQVVLPAEGLFVPAHRLLQGAEGVCAFVPVPLLDEDAQGHLPSAAGRETSLVAVQVAGYQGEQVTGFGERVVPDREVSAIRQIAVIHEVAVGEQHRTGFPVGDDGHRVDRQHIGPVREVGDGAESLGFALGAVHAPGTVEAFQEGVVLGPDFGGHLKAEGGRDTRNGQPFTVHRIAVFGQGGAVKSDTDERDALTVQPERPRARTGSRVCPYREP